MVRRVTCPPRSTPVKKRGFPNSKGARRTTFGKVCLQTSGSTAFPKYSLAFSFWHGNGLAHEVLRRTGSVCHRQILPDVTVGACAVLQTRRRLLFPGSHPRTCAKYHGLTPVARVETDSVAIQLGTREALCAQLHLIPSTTQSASVSTARSIRLASLPNENFLRSTTMRQPS